ncbi:hypothetical protein [Pedobacter glucosidilyticus]|uniref:hypothetical protein n=1 Tax=Pedobacter glucosidilyticus TaxID=1122941 RepID=UPI0026ED3648|nr:hypothetical protein [Pedobacter glucosidilyticus]
MSDEKKISEQFKAFKDLENKDLSLETKLDELILLLEKNELDTESIKKMQQKFNHVVNKKIAQKATINEIKDISLKNLDNIDKLNQLEILLNTNHIDSKQASKIKIENGLAKFVKVIIGFLMITLGFAMIILPTPHSFEMFTIFWFNPNDGITLMDLISLIIIATGVYIVIKSYVKFD